MLYKVIISFMTYRWAANCSWFYSLRENKDKSRFVSSWTSILLINLGACFSEFWYYLPAVQSDSNLNLAIQDDASPVSLISHYPSYSLWVLKGSIWGYVLGFQHYHVPYWISITTFSILLLGRRRSENGETSFRKVGWVCRYLLQNTAKNRIMMFFRTTKIASFCFCTQNWHFEYVKINYIPGSYMFRTHIRPWETTFSQCRAISLGDFDSLFHSCS